MSKNVVISLKDVSKSYSLKEKNKIFIALDNINLNIHKGDKVAIFGDNGAGKTTLLKLLAGITAPSKGEISIKGKVISLISLTAGFHPEFSGRENLYLNASLLGLTQKEIKVLERKIIDFAEINDFIDQPLYTYSSGMTLRLGFSIAIHANPDILILDEEIVVGDQDFQVKAYDKIEEIFEQGKTIIVSSHWLDFLRRLCNKFVWLEKGKIKISGNESTILRYKDKKRRWWKDEESLENQSSADFFSMLKMLPNGKSFELVASSSSMEPFILKGDKIKAVKLSLDDLEVGDIVLFFDEEIGELIVHRLKQKNPKIITKGDNNLLPDVFVKKENILGKILL